MKVSTRLYGTVGALLVLGILVSGLGTWYQRELGHELDAALNVTAVRIDKIDSIRARAWELIVAMQEAFGAGTLKDAQTVERAVAQWEVVRKRMHQQFDEIRPVLITDEDKALLVKFETGLSEFEPAAGEYLRLCRENKFDEISPLAAKMHAFGALFDTNGRDFRDLQMKLLKESGIRADSLRSRSMFVSVSLACLLMAPLPRFPPPARRWPRALRSRRRQSRKRPPPAKRSIPWPARTARRRAAPLTW
jgi:hypothetical protein